MRAARTVFGARCRLLCEADSGLGGAENVMDLRLGERLAPS